MKLITTIYTGKPFMEQRDDYQVVYRRRIFENDTGGVQEIVDSISWDRGHEDNPEFITYMQDVQTNSSNQTKIIAESVWKRYCKKLFVCLQDNNIIPIKS